MLIRSYADTSIGPCHRLRGIIWLDSPDEEMAHPMVMSADKISTMMLARPVFLMILPTTSTPAAGG